jgi:hypothetical protein
MARPRREIVGLESGPLSSVQGFGVILLCLNHVRQLPSLCHLPSRRSSGSRKLKVSKNRNESSSVDLIRRYDRSFV